MFKNLFFCKTGLLLFIFFFLSCSVCFAGPIGTVISLVPGVFAERNGARLPLRLKDSIYLQDILRSDASGKVQIIFEDDTVLTLGNNTTFSMQEYNDTDSPSFKGEVGKGFARFVTGEIVKKNPEAFKVQAPQCTIGIRGTTFAVQNTDEDTVVFTENSNNQQSVTANGITVPPGNKIGFHPDGTTEGVLPMTPKDRQNLDEQGSMPAASTASQQPAAAAGTSQPASGREPLPTPG